MFGFDVQALAALLTLAMAEGQDEGPMKMVAEGKQADFQSFIFWAYGLACLLLLLFSAWTVVQVRGLDQRIHHLRGRFEESRGSPGQNAGVGAE